MTSIAVTIAGSDSGGGAGIQADLKTFSALGVYGASVVTALTAQNTVGVQGVHDIPAEFVRQQIDSVFSDLAVNAVKIGMLSVPATIEAVAAGLDAHSVKKIVLDPVMVAASGDLLLQPEAISVLRERLLPMADLITPNLPEAAALLGCDEADNEAAMLTQAKALVGMGAKAVLIKGGHGAGAESVDLMLSEEGEVWLPARRVDTQNTHGTGCTLSSAITAGLARELALPDAVQAAKSYVTAAIEAADQLSIGSGHGPVHHFHALWATGGNRNDQ